jgi:hypothetical protein
VWLCSASGLSWRGDGSQWTGELYDQCLKQIPEGPGNLIPGQQEHGFTKQAEAGWVCGRLLERFLVLKSLRVAF